MISAGERKGRTIGLKW